MCWRNPSQEFPHIYYILTDAVLDSALGIVKASSTEKHDAFLMYRSTVGAARSGIPRCLELARRIQPARQGLPIMYPPMMGAPVVSRVHSY